MTSHRFFNVQIETTLELFPGVDTEVLVEARVELFTDLFGNDADGNRGELRTEVSSVEVHSLRVYFPGRPTVLFFRKQIEVQHFLTEPEFSTLVDLACERAFKEEGEEE